MTKLRQRMIDDLRIRAHKNIWEGSAMLVNRPLEAGVLIAFLLTIGFCSRIDPALSETVADNATGADAVEAIEDREQDR